MGRPQKRPFFDSLSNGAAARPLPPSLRGPNDQFGLAPQLKRLGELLTGDGSAAYHERAEYVLWCFPTRPPFADWENEMLFWTIEAEHLNQRAAFRANGLHVSRLGLSARTDLPPDSVKILEPGATLTIRVPAFDKQSFRWVCSLTRAVPCRSF